MSEHGPPPVTWTGLAAVLLTVVSLAVAATGPAVAEPTGPDTDLDGLDATEAGTTESVESATAEETVSAAANSTGGPLETEAVQSAGNATTDLTGTVDATTVGTSGLAASAELSGVSGTLVAATDGADANGTERRTGSAAPADSGSGTAPSELPPAAGTAAVGGAVAGGVVLRRGLSRSAWSAGRSLARTGRRALAASTDAGWPDWLRWLGGLFGYQRYDDSDPLEHDSRSAIQRVVEEADGAYLSEISRRTGIPLSTVRYHLNVLEHENLVTASKMRGKRMYVPLGTEPSALEAALKDDGAAAVLAALSAGAPASVSDIARSLDRDVSTVSHHLRRLADDDLVTRERDGRAVVNRLAPGVRESLERPPEDAMPATAPPRGLGVQTD